MRSNLYECMRVYRISGAVKILTALQLDDFQLKIVFDLIFARQQRKLFAETSARQSELSLGNQVESALKIPRHQVEGHGNGLSSMEALQMLKE